MKRLLTVAVLCLVTFVGAQKLSAQHNYGVVGGLTFSAPGSERFSDGMLTRYHAGFTYRFKMARGFSIQPSLLYDVKGGKTRIADVSIGYLELPVSFQWGPDLLLFRPFVDVSPFVGIGLNNKAVISDGVSVRNDWRGLSRWEYGLGLGGGLDIWKLQIVARYVWNFGTPAKDGVLSPVGLALGGRNFNGVTLSVGVLF